MKLVPTSKYNVATIFDYNNEGYTRLKYLMATARSWKEYFRYCKDNLQYCSNPNIFKEKPNEI